MSKRNKWSWYDIATLGVTRAVRLGFSFGRGKRSPMMEAASELRGEGTDVVDDEDSLTRREREMKAKEIIKEKGEISFDEAMEIWGVEQPDLPKIMYKLDLRSKIFGVIGICFVIASFFQQSFFYWMSTFLVGVSMLTISVRYKHYVWRIKNRTMAGFMEYLAGFLQ